MKKKILSFALAFCLIIPAAFMFVGCKDKKEPAKPLGDVWDGTTIEVSEAVNDVITIESAREFAGFAKSVNEGNNYIGITVELATNIDLNNKAWTPIGYGCYELPDHSQEKAFSGIFDGKGHTIYNLNIDYSTTALGGEGTGSAGIGLFGQLLDGAIVKNINVDTAVVKGNHFVAVIAGYSYLDVTIEHCIVKNAQVSCSYKDADDSGDKAGVIAGLILGNSVVAYCEARDSAVDAARDAGQVIGCRANSTSILNTASNVTVTDNNQTQDLSTNDNITNDIIGRDDDNTI